MSKLAEVAKVRALLRSGAARSIRVAAGISQAEVAADLGVSGATICRWERGNRMPRAPIALRYGALLHELMRAS